MLVRELGGMWVLAGGLVWWWVVSRDDVKVVVMVGLMDIALAVSVVGGVSIIRWVGLIWWIGFRYGGELRVRGKQSVCVFPILFDDIVREIKIAMCAIVYLMC